MSKRYIISGGSFKAGQTMPIDKYGQVSLPLDIGQLTGKAGAADVLCIQTRNGLQVIPRVVDVKNYILKPSINFSSLLVLTASPGRLLLCGQQ